MRDFFVSLFDFSDPSKAEVLKTVFTVIFWYFVIMLGIRIIRIVINKLRETEREYNKYLSTCTYLFCGRAIRKNTYKKNIFAIVLAVASVLLFYFSIHYESAGITDEVSKYMFIGAFAIDVVVVIYYTVLFFKDANRDASAFDSALNIPYGEMLSPDMYEVTSTTFEKWDFETSYHATDSTTRSYDANATANATTVIGNVLLFILQIISLIGSVVIYIVERMLNTVKTLIFGIIMRPIEKKYYSAKAKRLCKKHILGGIIHLKRDLAGIGFMHPANIILREVIKETRKESFDKLSKGEIPDMIVANHDPVSPKPIEIISFGNKTLICKEGAANSAITRYVFTDSKNGIYCVEINANGNPEKNSDYFGLMLELRHSPNNPDYYTHGGYSEIYDDRQLILYKWMMYNFLKYCKSKRMRGQVSVVLFFKADRANIHAFSFKTVTVALKDVVLDEQLQTYSLPTVANSRYAV